jgi:hypothetical protein
VAGWIAWEEPVLDRVDTVAYVGWAPRGEVVAPDYADRSPQAFSAWYPAGQALGAHFHATDQFQVVTRGGGRLGGHPVGVGSVHYADRNTPYGPIEPGPDGIEFLTMRSVAAAGAFFMPGNAERLAAALADDPGGRRPGDRRNLMADLAAVPTDDDGRAVDRNDPDGLRIEAVDIPAGATTEVVAHGDGAYLVVIAGAVQGDEGTPLGVGALRFLAPGQAAAVAASADGARLAVLQLAERPVPAVG